MIDYRTETGIQAVWFKINTLIDAHGWAVLSVDSAEDTPTYTYTIGLSRQGYPELLVMGLAPSVAQPMLNAIAQRIINETLSPVDGTMIQGAANMALCLKKAPIEDALFFTRAANRYARENSFGIEVFQIVLPDEQNKFPWDEGCSDKMKYIQDLESHTPKSSYKTH